MPIKFVPQSVDAETAKKQILVCLPRYPYMTDLAKISRRSGHPVSLCYSVIMQAVKEGKAINKLKDGKDLFCRSLTKKEV